MNALNSNYNKLKDLTLRTFSGIVLKDKDPLGLGRYLVYIRELSPVNTMNTFWVTSEISNFQFSRWIDPYLHSSLDESKKSSGSYFPLSAGMVVNIKFRSNDLTSGFIYKIVNNQNQVPLDTNKRDSFYLLCKTVNDSYIYIDEDKQTLHLMNNKGSTNIALNDQKITLHVGDLVSDGLDGITSRSIVELDKDKIGLKFGKHFIKIDDSGIILSAGENSNSFIRITESGIETNTNGNIKNRAEQDLSNIGKKVFNTGLDELHNYSKINRISGTQMMSMTGNVVTIDSLTETYIKGGHIGIESLFKTKLSSLAIDILSLTSIYVNSLMYVNNAGSAIVQKSPSVAIAGSTIFHDGMIMDNMGIAESLSSSLISSIVATSVATEGAAMSLTTAQLIGDEGSGAISVALNSSLTGSAQPANNILTSPTIINYLTTGVSQLVSYINGYEKSGKQNIFSPLPTPISI